MVSLEPLDMVETEELVTNDRHTTQNGEAGNNVHLALETELRRGKGL